MEIQAFEAGTDLGKRSSPSSDTEQLNVRIPTSLDERVKATARAEALEADLKGDESAHINTSFVVRQALRRYVDQYWDKYGGVPKNLKEESPEWLAFVEALKSNPPKR